VEKALKIDASRLLKSNKYAAAETLTRRLLPSGLLKDSEKECSGFKAVYQIVKSKLKE